MKSIKICKKLSRFWVADNRTGDAGRSQYLLKRSRETQRAHFIRAHEAPRRGAPDARTHIRNKARCAIRAIPKGLHHGCACVMCGSRPLVLAPALPGCCVWRGCWLACWRGLRCRGAPRGVGAGLPAGAGCCAAWALRAAWVLACLRWLLRCLDAACGAGAGSPAGVGCAAGVRRVAWVLACPLALAAALPGRCVRRGYWPACAGCCAAWALRAAWVLARLRWLLRCLGAACGVGAGSCAAGALRGRGADVPDQAGAERGQRQDRRGIPVGDGRSPKNFFDFVIFSADYSPPFRGGVRNFLRGRKPLIFLGFCDLTAKTGPCYASDRRQGEQPTGPEPGQLHKPHDRTG